MLKKGGHVRHHPTVAGVISLLCVLCVGGAESKAPTPPAPVLTEQEAVVIAKTANRQEKKAWLDIDRAAKSIGEAKTAYFPQSSAKVTSGYPLVAFRYNIPTGVLGTYPATGPIPATGSGITTNQAFTESTYAVVSQPIAQLYKIHIGVKMAQNAGAMAVQTARQQSQSVADQVRQSYHEICILQAKLETDASQQKALEETLRTVENNVARGVELAADKLQAKASLTQELYTGATDEDALVSAKEQLNMLLARDVDTDFSVVPPAMATDEELNLPEARATALKQRPEIQLSKLQVDKAKLDVRQERAGYIPDVNAQLTYVGFQNVDFLPKNAAVAGFSLNWKNPWDWGHRKANIECLR